MGGRLSRKGRSLSVLPGIHETPWVYDCGPREPSMCTLARIHETPWVYDCGPREPSMCTLARIHETSWVPATAGWGDPLPCMATSMEPHGRPRRPERCPLSLQADTHHASWVSPSRGLGTCLRAMRPPMEPHGCVLPVDARALPA